MQGDGTVFHQAPFDMVDHGPVRGDISLETPSWWNIWWTSHILVKVDLIFCRCHFSFLLYVYIHYLLWHKECIRFANGFNCEPMFIYTSRFSDQLHKSMDAALSRHCKLKYYLKSPVSIVTVVLCMKHLQSLLKVKWLKKYRVLYSAFSNIDQSAAHLFHYH